MAHSFFFVGGGDLISGMWRFPGQGVELELEPPAYTTATAMQDLSHVHDLHHSSQQHQIFSPLSKARDQTHNPMVTSQTHFHCATSGTPLFTFNKIQKIIEREKKATTASAGPNLWPRGFHESFYRYQSCVPRCGRQNNAPPKFSTSNSQEL